MKLLESAIGRGIMTAALAAVFIVAMLAPMLEHTGTNGGSYQFPPAFAAGIAVDQCHYFASAPAALTVDDVYACRIDAAHATLVAGEGVAGTPAGGVLSIQGVSGGTPVPVSGTVTITGNTAPGQYNDPFLALSTGTTSPSALDSLARSINSAGGSLMSTIVVGGTPANNNTVTVTIAGTASTYTVAGTPTTATVAAGLAAAINANVAVQGLAYTFVSSSTLYVYSMQNGTEYNVSTSTGGGGNTTLTPSSIWNGTLQSSAAQTATGQSATQIVSAHMKSLKVYTNVTAVSGTNPQLTILLQSSPDGGTTWYTDYTSNNITATGQYSFTIGLGSPNYGDFGQLVRVAWTIAGTSPSFTFSSLYVAK